MRRILAAFRVGSLRGVRRRAGVDAARSCDVLRSFLSSVEPSRETSLSFPLVECIPAAPGPTPPSVPRILSKGRDRKERRASRTGGTRIQANRTRGTRVEGTYPKARGPRGGARMPSSCKTIAPRPPENRPRPLRGTNNECPIRRDLHSQSEAWIDGERRGKDTRMRTLRVEDVWTSFYMLCATSPRISRKGSVFRSGIESKGHSDATQSPTEDLVFDDVTTAKPPAAPSCQRDSVLRTE